MQCSVFCSHAWGVVWNGTRLLLLLLLITINHCHVSEDPSVGMMKDCLSAS